MVADWVGVRLGIWIRGRSPTSGASQVALVVKNPPAIAGGVRVVSPIPGSGRAPGGRHGNPF